MAGATPPWLADALDWLNLWQPDAGGGDLADQPEVAPINHLSPRL
jgi:hypothetical protein